MTVRVLHVLEALEGGTARHLVDVVRHARSVVHEVVLPPSRVGGITDPAATDRLRAAGATIHLLPMRRTPWSPRNGESLARLARLVRARRPDVVHGHSSIGGLLARLGAVGTGRPCLYTPNGITQVRAGVVVERRLRRFTHRFVAVSASEGELAVELGLIGSDRLVVIPNGIELEAPPPVPLRARLGIDAGVPLVGTIARLVPQKAPEDFVAACALVGAALPDAHFVLIGGGELQAQVDAALQASGLGARFHQLESLPGAAGALGEFDVFTLSSRFEGGPYAPLEAMRARTAVVLTDCVGSRDAVEHGTSGLLVPVGDPAALATAVVELLCAAERRRQLAAAGRARVEERFTVELMGARLDELYTTVAGR
ncbi:MAG: glycosyltransferase family 4 protein [Acidimicrobiia bacterium]|nr:glycosyltransferase family 4 protein [Acidimicrobiia bacterium]